MPDFQILLRNWVKTSGFFTHAFVKRFFLLYPLLCIASDCYLQVQVAFQAWFETIEGAAGQPAVNQQESQVPAQATPAVLPQDTSITSVESHLTRIPHQNLDRALMGPEAGQASNPEQAINIEEAVRNFLAEDSDATAAEERWE